MTQNTLLANFVNLGYNIINRIEEEKKWDIKFYQKKKFVLINLN